jgi:predicted phosphoadenosine phosphosulfate sulfurtransferase
MAQKLSKRSISELMAWWGRKGGSRATEKQKNAALENLKRTPNYRKHMVELVTLTTTTTADKPTKEDQ